MPGRRARGLARVAMAVEICLISEGSAYFHWQSRQILRDCRQIHPATPMRPFLQDKSLALLDAGYLRKLGAGPATAYVKTDFPPAVKDASSFTPPDP